MNEPIITVLQSERHEPTVGELVDNFKAATGRWVKAGFPVVTQATYAARAEACGSCELWNAKAYLGVGRCEACGCCSLKRWLSTERCPMGLWPQVDQMADNSGEAGR